MADELSYNTRMAQERQPQPEEGNPSRRSFKSFASHVGETLGKMIDAPDPKASRWIMNTGEGRCVAAGSDILETMDVHALLESRQFRLASEAVKETKVSPDSTVGSLLDASARIYQQKLHNAGLSALADDREQV